MFDIKREANPKFLRNDYPNGVRTLPTICNFFDTGKINVDRDGKLIDDNAVWAFTRGQCHAFALAVHKLTGFEVKGLWRESDVEGLSVVDEQSPGHVVAKAPDGRLLDITGHPLKYMKTISFHVGAITTLDPKEVPHMIYYFKPNVTAAIPFARTLLEQEGYGEHILKGGRTQRNTSRVVLPA
jgi:hypothetical protein